MSARSVTRSPLHPVGREQIAQCIFHIPFATSRAGSGPMCTRVGGLEISFFSCTLQEVPVCPLTLPRTAQVPLLLVTTVNCVPLCVCVRHHNSSPNSCRPDVSHLLSGLERHAKRITDKLKATRPICDRLSCRSLVNFHDTGRV